MRPLELELRGFRSYADDTAIGFEGRTLVGIVGPIGSGKSSLLDAISFALFGKTPKVERDTKSLINQRRDTLHVSLMFEVGGTRWKAVRSLRRGGASAHALYRVDDGVEHEVTDKAREMGEEVETILGMDFAAFRRSVLLAQNQFSAFLEATGTERNQVLKGVFGFDRLDAMRDAARVRLDGLGAVLQVLSSRRATADADRKELEVKRKELVVAEERAATLEALRTSVDQADGVLKEAEKKVADAIADLTMLEAISGDVPGREDVEEVLAAARDSETAVVETEKALAGAAEAHAAASRTLEKAVQAAGGRDALQEVGELVARWQAAAATLEKERERLAAADAGIEELEKATLEARKAAHEAEERLDKANARTQAAVTAEEAARAALHAAHDADRAHSLRQTLAEGEPCPVCAQVVSSLPPPAEAGEVDEAEERLRVALDDLESARTAATAAATLRAEAVTRVESADKELAGARRTRESIQKGVESTASAASDMESTLQGRLGEGDPVERLEHMRRRVSAAEEADQEARMAEVEARKARDAAVAARDKARKGLDDVRTTIVKIATRLEIDVAAPEDASGIETALTELRKEVLERHAAATQRKEAAAHEVEAARAARTDLFEKAGMAAADDIVEIAQKAGREATEIGIKVSILEKNLATLDELGAQEKQALADQALLQRLHGDLAPSRFLEFLLDERRRVLADLASVHLEVLTAGRYRFTEDGEFNMIDLAAADMVRSPVSLSGGETFLASLALALALSEIVAREGGRLDAFFLDEGFGSLDPEHLDLAMDGVERLVASGADRLVVIVSHVPALRERIEDLIVLDRDPVTGVTAVRSGAGPQT
ncbi:MAG TPA: SMC family ATPase [Acidimicrobiia bacterium]|nr:SMC family ATPase [Acidimicrobiia bacterium]